MKFIHVLLSISNNNKLSKNKNMLLLFFVHFSKEKFFI